MSPARRLYDACSEYTPTPATSAGASLSGSAGVGSNPSLRAVTAVLDDISSGPGGGRAVRDAVLWVNTRASGRTPLHAACASDTSPDASLVRALLAFLGESDDVSMATVDGLTPLHVAASRPAGAGDSSAMAVRALLARGASMQAVSRSGLTPLLEAERAGFTAAADAIRRHARVPFTLVDFDSVAVGDTARAEADAASSPATSASGGRDSRGAAAAGAGSGGAASSSDDDDSDDGGVDVRVDSDDDWSDSDLDLGAGRAGSDDDEALAAQLGSDSSLRKASSRRLAPLRTADEQGAAMFEACSGGYSRRPDKRALVAVAERIRHSVHPRRAAQSDAALSGAGVADAGAAAVAVALDDDEHYDSHEADDGGAGDERSAADSGDSDDDVEERRAIAVAQAVLWRNPSRMGLTPLHVAADLDRSDGSDIVVELLSWLPTETDVDVRAGPSGKTPLHSACTFAKPKTTAIEALLARGADPNLTDNVRVCRVVSYACAVCCTVWVIWRTMLLLLRLTQTHVTIQPSSYSLSLTRSRRMARTPPTTPRQPGIQQPRAPSGDTRPHRFGVQACTCLPRSRSGRPTWTWRCLRPWWLPRNRPEERALLVAAARAAAR